MSLKPWYGFDLDGTLAGYEHKWQGPQHIGKPIEGMVAEAKRLLEAGEDVRIFTARVYPLGVEPSATPFTLGEYHERLHEAIIAKTAIENWCIQVVGQVLPVTCMKDYGMLSLYDDRAIQVIPNTGKTLQQEFDEYKAETERKLSSR